MRNLQNIALEMASNVLNWTDEAIQKFTSLESLPEALDCKPRCHYCCYSLPMVTPPYLDHALVKSCLDKKRLKGHGISVYADLY